MITKTYAVNVHDGCFHVGALGEFETKERAIECAQANAQTDRFAGLFLEVELQTREYGPGPDPDLLCVDYAHVADFPGKGGAE
jgi:hypothetical protein